MLKILTMKNSPVQGFQVLTSSTCQFHSLVLKLQLAHLLVRSLIENHCNWEVDLLHSLVSDWTEHPDLWSWIWRNNIELQQDRIRHVSSRLNARWRMRKYLHLFAFKLRKCSWTVWYKLHVGNCEQVHFTQNYIKYYNYHHVKALRWHGTDKLIWVITEGNIFFTI